MTDEYGNDETFNPWTVVNLVFHHLAEQGLHPALGSHGDPGAAAHALLLALGITPAAEGNRQIRRDVYAHLAEIRLTVFGDARDDGATDAATATAPGRISAGETSTSSHSETLHRAPSGFHSNDSVAPTDDASGDRARDIDPQGE